MTDTMPIDTAQLSRWAAEKMDPETVRAALESRGLDPDSIKSYMAEFRKLRNARKQFGGFLCCGIGAFLGFVGCVLSMINPVPELYGFFLYGLTSLAILVIFAGLYLLFE
jgi:hypothetical protein